MEQVKAVVDDPSSFVSGFMPPRPPSILDGWATPVAPLSDDSPTTMSMVEVLDDLAGAVVGVRGAILASVAGFGLAWCSSMADEPSHPAILAAAVGLAQQLAAMGGGSSLHQLVVDHDAGLLLVWPIGTQRVLALMATTRVDQRKLRAGVQRQASTLAGVIT
jgi:predicted regulator of Ras-like GTPase activity (Roadblock/LC7/MglB family)